MSVRTGRRTFLAGAAALAVVGFDPVQRTWLTEAHAKKGPGIAIPGLDGELTLDPAALAEAADDFGHIVSRTPIAVLRPASQNDVMKMVKYANQHGLKVAMRGQGHSTMGQAQVDGGVVIDSRSLDVIHSIQGDRAVVDAGVTWSSLLTSSLAAGLTPPVLTDYLDLSVGGTLSVGGIGGVTHRKGLQLDNVLALEVVTGDGKKRSCSRTQRKELFEAVLGGLGQFAIITRATIKLEPAEASARVYRLYYSDIDSYVADQISCSEDERFDYLEGQVLPDGQGGFQYMIEGAVWFTSPDEPIDDDLTSDLAYESSAIEDLPYEVWLRRLEPLVAFLTQIGVWSFPHPWFDVFLPASTAASVVTAALASVPPDTQDPILFYPFKRSRLRASNMIVPDEADLFLFDILRTAPPIPGVPEALVDLNRSIYDYAAALGGKKYPISSIPFSPSDWAAHYGARWPQIVALKDEYDPENVLTPGQGIFP